MKKYLENFENCLEREIPYCVAECPFHMEIFNFMEKAGRGAATAAFKVYRNAVGFPRIANQLCSAPCRNVCPRDESGGAVNIPLLEKASMELATNTAATDYNIPPKKERIAIIGAGLAGMAACLRLSTKKYHVEIFEETNRIGGNLWNLMDSTVFLTDIDEQLAHQDYEIHFNTQISSAEALEQWSRENGPANGDNPAFFDAVYVATGKGGTNFGLLDSISDMGDPYCKKIGPAAYFAGGELIEDEPIYALANGLHIGTVIDNYLKTGYMYYPSIRQSTRMCKGMEVINNTSSEILPADGCSYTKEEFMSEASRCVKCQCQACRQQCDLAEFTDKWPVRMRDEIVATTLEGKSELKATPAKRLMSMCNQCGLCKEVCPEKIDLDGLFLAGRQKMHRQGKMPWPFHDFWLRDMAQANSNACAISGFPNGSPLGPFESSCAPHVFFPGCQLGASEPALVTAAYSALLSKDSNTGMLLQCCGIPLLWSGDTSGFEAYLHSLSEKWVAMNKPTLILACMTCMKTFKEYLPDIPVISLYEMLDLRKVDICKSSSVPVGIYSIFNPCAARHETSTREAVASLVENAGIHCIPLDDNEEYAKCCGYGGHGQIANPDYTSFVAKKRIAENDYPYITYCINCRDLFIKNGKKAIHILNILAGTSVPEKIPTVTERQQNRVLLHRNLTSKYFPTSGDESMNENKPNLDVIIRPELKTKLDKELILEDEIAHTIDFCQRHNRRIFDESAGTYSGYCQIGYMTYWVEYKELNATSFELVNAYAHRMQIELEAVWNGVKQETDLQ